MKFQRSIPEEVKNQLINLPENEMVNIENIWEMSKPKTEHFIQPDEEEIEEKLTSVWEKIGINDQKKGKTAKRNIPSQEPGRRLPLLAAMILLSFGFNWIDSDELRPETPVQQTEIYKSNNTRTEP